MKLERIHLGYTEELGETEFKALFNQNQIQISVWKVSIFENEISLPFP